MRDSEFPYSTLLDSMSDGICVYDKDGRFVYVNNAVVNIRGIPRQQYLGMNVHDLYKSQYIDICVFDLVCKQKKEATVFQRYHLVGKPGWTRLVTASPLFDDRGHIQYVVAVLRDIAHYEELYKKAVADNQIASRTVVEDASPMPTAESPKMHTLLSVARNVAALDSTVVLYGESGTGKEVLAHFIHENSPRSAKPMVVVNCGAFPESLLDAELFGYEKGSFTGALSTGKIGLAEAADGGTLFLDEINSFPLSLQSKLLRLIENKSIKPIGSVKSKRVDFRLIAATNADLDQMVRNGLFRADLYYRLNVVPLNIPSLRERKEDIIPLCNHFLSYFSERYGLTKSLSKSVLHAAYSYDWPGNVRELRNFIERVMVMTPSNVTHITSLPPGMLGGAGAASPQPSPENREKLTKEDIVDALKLCNGHREQTARQLRISRRTLQYKLREFGIVPDRS